MLGQSASSPQVLYAGTAITPPKKNPAVQCCHGTCIRDAAYSSVSGTIISATDLRISSVQVCEAYTAVHDCVTTDEKTTLALTGFNSSKEFIAVLCSTLVDAHGQLLHITVDCRTCGSV
eukprot:1208-Heterococcus_DN1.PRE.2